MLHEVLSFTLLSFTAIFFVVDPLATVPVFLSMTRNDSTEKKRRMARTAALTAFGVLTLFAVAGTLIFKVFGVTLGAFKVAGGILLMTTSFEMLRAQKARTRVTPEEEKEGEEKEDVAIVPLAIPLLAGPGAIATVTTLGAQKASLLFAAPVVASIAVTCALSYLILREANRIAEVLGVTGMTVMNRLIGLIVGAIAVQFIFDGVREAFPGLGA